MTAFHVIIPARYHSTRFPGKLMQEIQGKTVLQRVHERAQQSGAASIIIATDHEDMAAHARSFGATVSMTAATHKSGTDRIAEVVATERFPDDAIIVNVQGDEPFIPPALIQQVAMNLSQSTAPVATLCWPIESREQLENPNVVKVVFDKNKKALYFSRSPIPAHRDQPASWHSTYRHIGLYAYRADFLTKYTALAECDLETCEMLEQLRVLWAGYAILVDLACEKPVQDINTPEDLLSLLDLFV